jgi:bifunctional non-homologous end joining protein LigD
VFDLDPLVDDDAAMRGAALLLRALLAELGCRSWVKTSGSRGFHVFVPLDGTSDWGTVARVGHSVGRELVRRDPERLTQEFHKADRGGRIFVDTGRNEIGATHAAAYSVRPKPTAPISAPCTWEEVESGAIAPRSVTLRGMARRLDTHGDLWADMHRLPQTLPTLS